MKKLLTVVALALTTLTMSAQVDANLHLVVGGGLSSVVGADANTKTKFAYKAGALYDIQAAENFYITPGIEFVNKGFKNGIVVGNIDDVYIDGDINTLYVQVPVFAAYKYPIADNMKLVAKAGPYVAYGILGTKIEVTYLDGTKTYKESYNIFDKDLGHKRFDAGAIVGLELEMEQFSVGLEYSRGFTKVKKGAKAYNQAFGIVLGFKI